jgi:glutamyl-tRNA synthetase
VPDAIRGDVAFENAGQQDAVLLKSDGFPTYHLAYVVDDHLMQISHVMRANEWLPSAALHIQLWQAFGWEMPIHMHLPVMLNPNGKGKMSKRNPPKDDKGNIIPVMVHDYIKAGYLPEAIVNFLANTGWTFGDEREVFSIEEAIERFDGTGLQAANSAFPVSKLEWINGVYIREHLSVDELAKRLRPFLEEAGLEVNVEVLMRVAPLVQTRLAKLSEIVGLAGFFFREEFVPAPSEELLQKRMDAAQTRTALARAYETLAALADFAHNVQHDAMLKLTTELGLSNSQLFGVLRVAVTGQKISTPLFESMEIIGKDEVLRRIKLAAESLKEPIA